MIIENKLTYGGNVLRKENCFGKEANSAVKERGFRGLNIALLNVSYGARFEL